MARTSPRATARISAAASTEAKGRVVADSANVRPISPAMLHRIVDIRPARHVVIEPSLPLWQVLVMFAVAAFIGVLLATGGAL